MNTYKFLLFNIFIIFSLPLFSSTWYPLESVEIRKNIYNKFEKLPVNMKGIYISPLLHKFYNGEPINVHLTEVSKNQKNIKSKKILSFEDFSALQEKVNVDLFLRDKIKQSFINWANATKKFIPQNEIFSDLTKFQNYTKDNIKFVKKEKDADIKFYFYDNCTDILEPCQNKTALACADFNENKIYFCNNEFSADAITHELGHIFGLADLYYADSNQSRNTNYGSILPQYTHSIMNIDDDVSCDDIEGIVNLIDIYVLRQKGKRFNQKWDSFCYDNAYYEHAKLKNKDDNIIFTIRHLKPNVKFFSIKGKNPTNADMIKIVDNKPLPFFNYNLYNIFDAKFVQKKYYNNAIYLRDNIGIETYVLPLDNVIISVKNGLPILVLLIEKNTIYAMFSNGDIVVNDKEVISPQFTLDINNQNKTYAQNLYKYIKKTGFLDFCAKNEENNNDKN